MKIVGLITEYNPFHAGHLYHMQQARELTGADYCVVLMSGSFVQRGEPAIFDKYRPYEKPLFSPVPTWYLRCRPPSPPLRRMNLPPMESRFCRRSVWMPLCSAVNAGRLKSLSRLLMR